MEWTQISHLMESFAPPSTQTAVRWEGSTVGGNGQRHRLAISDARALFDHLRGLKRLGLHFRRELTPLINPPSGTDYVWTLSSAPASGGRGSINDASFVSNPEVLFESEPELSLNGTWQAAIAPSGMYPSAGGSRIVTSTSLEFSVGEVASFEVDLETPGADGGTAFVGRHVEMARTASGGEVKLTVMYGGTRGTGNWDRWPTDLVDLDDTEIVDGRSAYRIIISKPKGWPGHPAHFVFEFGSLENAIDPSRTVVLPGQKPIDPKVSELEAKLTPRLLPQNVGWYSHPLFLALQRAQIPTSVEVDGSRITVHLDQSKWQDVPKVLAGVDGVVDGISVTRSTSFAELQRQPGSADPIDTRLSFLAAFPGGQDLTIVCDAAERPPRVPAFSETTAASALVAPDLRVRGPKEGSNVFGRQSNGKVACALWAAGIRTAVAQSRDNQFHLVVADANYDDAVAALRSAGASVSNNTGNTRIGNFYLDGGYIQLRTPATCEVARIPQLLLAQPTAVAVAPVPGREMSR